MKVSSKFPVKEPRAKDSAKGAATVSTAPSSPAAELICAASGGESMEIKSTGKHSTWTSDQRSAFILINDNALRPKTIAQSELSRWRRRHRAANIPRCEECRMADAAGRFPVSAAAAKSNCAVARRRTPTDSAAHKFLPPAPPGCPAGRPMTISICRFAICLRRHGGDRPARVRAARRPCEKVRVCGLRPFITAATCIGHVMS